VARKWFAYPVLLRARRVFEQYGVRGIPVTFAIDRDGRITNRYVGYRPGTERQLEAEAGKLLAARTTSRQRKPNRLTALTLGPAPATPNAPAERPRLKRASKIP
jgi:hypothetical protein